MIVLHIFPGSAKWFHSTNRFLGNSYKIKSKVPKWVYHHCNEFTLQNNHSNDNDEIEWGQGLNLGMHTASNFGVFWVLFKFQHLEPWRVWWSKVRKHTNEFWLLGECGYSWSCDFTPLCVCECLDIQQDHQFRLICPRADCSDGSGRRATGKTN